MAEVRLIEVTPAHLEALLRSRTALAEALDTPVPDGWPEFPEAIDFTLGVLQKHPEQHAWWMHFFLDAESGALVGSGGFAGPPVDRTVEIGYEIAPGFRRRGYASAAVRALVAKARRTGVVDRVIAHTLPADPASAGVLRIAGFEYAGEVADPEQGAVAEWAFSLQE
ncbi:GNAT family N-acetyltransferase [Lysobacter korlensis]|uniref:GNAT family N-acetyltransferase n=1 Tax=Lysobacter korlensis TaxID=553636 RepID=A0ABV6RVC7_9GAMM